MVVQLQVATYQTWQIAIEGRVEQRPQPMGMPKGNERQHGNILGYLIFAPKLIH
jgi:hypothetical protein